MASVDLGEYVDSLKREVSPPDADLYASVTTRQWTQYMTDAFWEARLDGFFEDYVCDVDGFVSPVDLNGPEFGRTEIALVVLYAGVRVLRLKVVNTNSVFRAKAGPVEFEQQTGVTMLAEMLRQLKSQKDALLERASIEGTKVVLYDALSVRSWMPASYYGSIELI